MANSKRWSMGGSVDPQNNIVKPGSGFTTQSIEDAFTNLFGDISSNDVLNSAGDSINADQLLLQYLLGEQNWNRTNPNAVAQRLQAMGMSRSAALQAAAGVQGAETQVSPFSAQGVNAQPIFQGISAATSLYSAGVSSAVQLSTLPFDKRVKAATADLLTRQGTMLAEQRQGLALAAAAVQTASNSEFDFAGQNATTLLDHLATLEHAAPLLQSIKSNPYAFASLSQMLSQDYSTRGLSYEPERAEHAAAQQRALAKLANNDVKNIEFNNTLLANQVYRDQVATALYGAVEYAKANNFIKQSEIDEKRLNNIMENIHTFCKADLEILNAQIAEAQMITNPEIRQARINAIVNSYRFQAKQALYGMSLTDLYQQTFDNQMKDTEKRVDLNHAAEDFLYGITLGGYEDSKLTQGWLNSIGSTITGVGACVLAGMKIFGPKVITPPMLNGYNPSSTIGGVNYFGIQ